MKESSGIDWVINGLHTIVSFDDDTCPVCGKGKLKLSSIYNHGIRSFVNYECDHCGFICPIDHDIKNLQNLKPIYDDRISEFIKEFGLYKVQS